MSNRVLSRILRSVVESKPQPKLTVCQMSTNSPGTPEASVSKQHEESGQNKEQDFKAYSDSDMPFIVGHDKTKKEFYINIEDGGKRRKDSAVLQYEWIRPNFVDLQHTEVPPAYRGQGIAKLLAKAALEHFATEDIKMKLSCTYLQKYVLDTRVPRIWDSIVWDD